MQKASSLHYLGNLLKHLTPLWVLLNLLACSTFVGLERLNTNSQYRPSGNLIHPYRDHNLGKRKSITKGPFMLNWPVDKYRLSQTFAPSTNPSHQGIDLSGSRGTPIYSSHSGLVVYTGQGYSGYGKLVILEYNQKWATVYAHLSKINVREGQNIKAGQILGKMGRTGRASGVHLHFELIRDKQPINPLPLLRSNLATND